MLLARLNRQGTVLLCGRGCAQLATIWSDPLVPDARYVRLLDIFFPDRRDGTWRCSKRLRLARRTGWATVERRPWDPSGHQAADRRYGFRVSPPPDMQRRDLLVRERDGHTISRFIYRSDPPVRVRCPECDWLNTIDLSALRCHPLPYDRPTKRKGSGETDGSRVLARLSPEQIRAIADQEIERRMKQQYTGLEAVLHRIEELS